MSQETLSLRILSFSIDMLSLNIHDFILHELNENMEYLYLNIWKYDAAIRKKILWYFLIF